MLLTSTPGYSNDVSSAVIEIDGALPHFHIYPNPTQGVVIVESESFPVTPEAIVVINAYGQIALKAEWQERLTLDISHLPNGLYILASQENEQIRSVGKIIKQ